MKRLLLAAFLLLSPYLLRAHDRVEMADALRSNGKIYVVVAVVAIIFVGLCVYLFMMDRRLSKLEKSSGK